MPGLENFRLVVFRAVAEHLSFRKAAEQLFLTQPAVSLQIKALEEELGVPLFDRGGTHVQLTEAGSILLDYAQRVKALLEEADQALAARAGQHAGHLALGASTTIAQYVLPRLLTEFRNDHPRVQTTVISGNTEEIVDAVETQKISLGLIEGPAQRREVKTEPFLMDELVMVVPSSHEWAERTDIVPGEISGAALLMRERGSGTRRVVEIELERHGVKRSSLQIVMELDSTEAIKSAVEAGLGVGFVSRWALAKDARLGTALKIVAIDGLRMRRNFLVTFRSGLEPQGLPQEFRRFLTARTNNLRGPTRAAPKKAGSNNQNK